MDKTRDPRRTGRLLWDKVGAASDLTRTIVLLGVVVSQKPMGPELTQVMADCACVAGLMEVADGRLIAEMRRMTRTGGGMPRDAEEWLPLALKAKRGMRETGSLLCPWMVSLLAAVMRE